MQSYAVEGELYVPRVQRGRSLIRADHRSKVIKAGVDFNQEPFVLENNKPYDY